MQLGPQWTWLHHSSSNPSSSRCVLLTGFLSSSTYRLRHPNRTKANAQIWLLRTLMHRPTQAGPTAVRSMCRIWQSNTQKGVTLSSRTSPSLWRADRGYVLKLILKMQTLNSFRKINANMQTFHQIVHFLKVLYHNNVHDITMSESQMLLVKMFKGVVNCLCFFCAILWGPLKPVLYFLRVRVR